MKKLIAVSAVAALAATALSAEITFGCWVRALAAPVASDGKDTVTSAGNSWGYGVRTARLDVNATSEDGKAGFVMGVYNDAFDGIAAGDNAYCWVKPIDMVKVAYGRYDNNALRGDLCYGSWNWLRPTSSWLAGDEGLLMSGMSIDWPARDGLLAEITPMENLYIQVMAPITTTQTKADATYKNLRGGFAYTIPGTAKVKFQYIGKGKGSVDEVKGKDADGNEVIKTPKQDGNSNCDIEAEVDVLAVENLFLGVGFRYDSRKDGKTANAGEENMKIALGATYQVNDQLKVSASGAFFTFYGEKIDSRFQAGAGVDYDLGDGLGVNADFRYLSKAGVDGKKTDNTDHIAFSAGVVKNVSSNGCIGVAFQGQTNSGTFANTVIKGATSDEGKADKFVWAIPVSISVWF